MLKSEIIAFVDEVQINKKETGNFCTKLDLNIREKWQEHDLKKWFLQVTAVSSVFTTCTCQFSFLGGDSSALYQYQHS